MGNLRKLEIERTDADPLVVEAGLRRNRRVLAGGFCRSPQILAEVDGTLVSRRGNRVRRLSREADFHLAPGAARQNSAGDGSRG